MILLLGYLTKVAEWTAFHNTIQSLGWTVARRVPTRTEWNWAKPIRGPPPDETEKARRQDPHSWTPQYAADLWVQLRVPTAGRSFSHPDAHAPQGVQRKAPEFVQMRDEYQAHLERMSILVERLAALTRRSPKQLLVGSGGTEFSLGRSFLIAHQMTAFPCLSWLLHQLGDNAFTNCSKTCRCASYQYFLSSDVLILLSFCSLKIHLLSKELDMQQAWFMCLDQHNLWSP